MCSINTFYYNYYCWVLLFHRDVAPRKYPPDPPVKPIVLNKTDSSITLSWSRADSERPVPVNGYVVERRKVGAQTWVRVTGMELVSTSQYTISNFTEESSYQFRISAINNFGQSAYLEVPGTYYLGKWTLLTIIFQECIFQYQNRSHERWSRPMFVQSRPPRWRQVCKAAPPCLARRPPSAWSSPRRALEVGRWTADWSAAAQTIS